MSESQDTNLIDATEKENTAGKKECAGCQPCTNCPSSMEEQEADEGMDRAQFFRAAFACTAMCWGGVTLLPIFMYLNPPQTEETKSKVTSLEVCKLSELPKGTGRNFRFGSFPALVIHTDDGQLHAFKAICTHLGCTVQFRTDKQDIYCACHGGQYDPSTGKNIAGPPPKPLPALKAEVINDMVIVSRV
ncbi:MAG: Rieske (2Fe-2S) protein [Cyanobacteria bacterium SZAS-4]|nr:Rieske (2Fe-2S) protein [Cyanobacteria bacterium SZAS-4]